MSAPGSGHKRKSIAASMAVSLWVAILAGTAIAGPFEDATSAYTRGDYATALQLWRPLADHGNATAQFSLGLMYSDGQGVPQDYVEAHKWFNLAASRFPTAEAENRDRAVNARDAVAAKMTPVQIAEAQKLAREWKQILVASPTIPATRRNLDKISGEAPYYPSAAIRAGIFEGKVVARVFIDEMGDVYEVHIVSAEPSRYFDHAVIETLQQWKFRGDGKKYVGEVELKFAYK